MMNVRALVVGLKVVEVPSFEAARVHGIGRLRTIPDGWRVLKTIFKEFVDRRALANRQHHTPAAEAPSEPAAAWSPDFAYQPVDEIERVVGEP